MCCESLYSALLHGLMRIDMSGLGTVMPWSGRAVASSTHRHALGGCPAGSVEEGVMDDVVLCRRWGDDDV